jgi:hypothetical protein
MSNAQAYNAQAVVCAEGSQLILATAVVATPADAPSFASTILGMETGIGLPSTVLADTGFASREAVATLQARRIEPHVVIGRTQPHRPTTSGRHPSPRPRAASLNPGASPCWQSWKPPMPKSGLRGSNVATAATSNE